MNYASHENCREVYELSGWQTGTFIYYRADGHRIEQLVGRPKPGWVPAYDLDFMKRRVPVGDEGNPDTVCLILCDLFKAGILAKGR